MSFRGVRYKPNLVMTPNENAIPAQNFPNLYQELLGIYTDLKVFNFALHHQAEMPENDRGELPFTGDRIIQRLEIIVDQTSSYNH